MDERTNNNEAITDGVRLVGRREAEAAIQSGHALTKTSLQQQILIGEQRAIDLRDEEQRELSDAVQFNELQIEQDIEQDVVPEEQMSLPEDEDELPEVEPSVDLPHWTDPPTGEVPALLRDLDDSEPELQPGPGAWSFTSLSEASGLGDEATNDIDFEELADDPFDALPPSPFRTSPTPGEVIDGASAETASASVGSDTPSSNQTAAQEESSTAAQAPPITDSNPPPRPSAHDVTMEKVELLKKSSLSQRLGTGIVFAGLSAAAFMAGPRYILALVTVTVLLAAMEYFDAVRRVGYRPPTALGLMSVAGAVLGVYARGEAAIPLVLVLVTIFTFLWYLAGVIEESPTANTAVTLLGIVWTGIFGSYAALLLREPDRHGVAFILGGVLCVIAYDTAAYIGGTLIGKHTLAPRVSPGKTWEGLACATVASMVVGGLIVQAMSPWTIGGGLLLGLVVAVVAPIGDLAESMVKRDLGLKDMGRILPGHGGIFDRFDAMLLVLPATYYLVRMLDLG